MKKFVENVYSEEAGRACQKNIAEFLKLTVFECINIILFKNFIDICIIESERFSRPFSDESSLLTNFARVCGVGFANMSLYATSMFFFDAEITILVAVSDVPPRSKKLSSAKTLSSSRTVSYTHLTLPTTSRV